MKTEKTVLLINGSPRKNGGTSGAISEYLSNRLKEKGLSVKILCARSSITKDEHINEMLDIVGYADTMAVIFPLYVDSLPYPVTKVLELAAKNQNLFDGRKKQGFLAIANSGFPEAVHNKTALSICRKFSEETGRTWIGGFGLAGGGIIDGRLDKAGRLAVKLKKSLDLAAEAIIEEKPLPSQIKKLMAGPLVPKWLYLYIAETRWKKTAYKNGTWKKINDTPYGENHG